MKIFASFLSRLFFFTVLCELFQLILSQVGAQNKAVFQVLTGPQEFLKASDIITFKPSAYTGSPWNFTMSDLLDSGDFKKSVGFWVRHNMTSPPSSAITLVRGASTLSKTPVIATDAHFLVYLEASGNNTQIKLRYLVSGSTVVKQTLVSNITLQPYNWYGVFVSRSSTSTDDRGILFVYDPSTIVGNNYNSDLQSVIATPLGYQKAAATSKFYIDIGGDSQTAIACNCDITNFNFLYKQDYFENVTDILELIKQPPNLRLWLQYEELDDTLELTADDSNSSNVVFRGDSQFDTNRDTQLNYDLTANGEVGHVYSQSGFDTIYPAFDLGREFTISFWLQFATRPSSVTNDTFQPVFFAHNSQYPQMKVYVAFETTVDSVTGIYVQSGMYGFTETLAQPIPRSNGGWYYFSVSYANFYKNDSAVDFTFNPTTLYTVRYILADGTMATPITGILNDSYIYGGTTDIMRIGMGVDGNNENLFATIKKLQIFSGSWAFDVVNDTCLHAIGGDKVIHITQGILSSHTYCQTCTTGYNLTDDDCMGDCPNGFYSVNDTNFYHCENCYENCLTCTGRKSEQCLSCTFGAWKPFDTITCPAINPCNSHQFDQNSVCVECQDQCATCKSQSTCSACAQGFSYNLNTFACEIQICGDGVVDTGEQCDDGNQVNGDGCSSACKIEVGWYCNFAGGACYSICGDNLLASNEGCDDGNNHNGDGCAYNCTVEPTYFCSQGPSGIGPFTDISYKENCTVCDPDCSVCATATTCSQCQTGKFLYNGRCQDNCTQSGLYQDTASLSCKTCPNLCAECTNATFCTSCTGSAALYNNKCYSTCPNGMYNGLDSTGVRRCLTCPSNCVTCSSATSCYTCNTGYFLDSSGSCAACNETCKTCRGPAATDCVLCAPGLTLQKNTSTCIVLSCQSNQFTNYDLGQCQDCDPSCATCSSTLPTGCLTCNAGEALTLTNQCLACTAANGLTLAADGTCVEICGDGKRLTSSKQCDDGNLINGDGCSSACTIETGWSCSGGNETSPDTCVSIVGPTPIIIVNPDDPTSFQISFNKEIINTLQDKDYLAQIIVALEGVPAENSDYNIFYNPQNQSFTVVFDLTRSVLDSMLTVQFKDSSRITDLSRNPVTPAITMVAYPTYYYVDPETINAANGLSTFSIVIQSINTVTIIPLALTGYLAHYWMFLEYFQIVNYLTYMNVRTPYIVNEFFKSFRYLQLSWLPNAPKGADMNYDRASQLGDYKFAYTNTLFLENAGYQLTTWAFLIALWMVLRAIIRVGFKKSILKYLIYHVMLNLEWSIILRAVIETFFAFCLFTYLQLSNFSTSGAVVTASSLLSIVALLFTLAFPIFCFLKTSKIRNFYLLDLETEYDTLYREFRKKRSTTTGFITLILFQKVVIAAILVGLQASIETQIAIFAIEQIVMLLILIVMRPYVDGSMNFRAVVQELILFAVVTLFYGLLDENTDENVRNNVGKVMVGLLIVALLMHCAFLIKDSYHAIKEHIQTPENSRKIFGKVRISPNGQDEFRISHGSGFGSSGRLDVPGSEANLISNNPNAETIGDTMLGEELSKPSGTKIRDGSLFGDNETVQIAPSQNSLAGEGDNLMGGTVPSRPSLELREPKKLNRIPWRP